MPAMSLTGLITAATLVRPAGILDLTASSVRKKMKSKGFARNVNREDIARGAADFGVDLNEHIQFLIDALKPLAVELGWTKGSPQVLMNKGNRRVGESGQLCRGNPHLGFLPKCPSSSHSLQPGPPYDRCNDVTPCPKAARLLTAASGERERHFHRIERSAPADPSMRRVEAAECSTDWVNSQRPMPGSCAWAGS